MRKNREELSKILAFGEKYKKEGENMKKEFRRTSGRKDFLNLLSQYEKSKKIFIDGLNEEEQEMINSLDGISKEKFYEEYLNDRIIYSGDIRVYSRDAKDWDKIKYEGENGNLEGLKNFVSETGNKLKQGMIIYIEKRDIGDAGAEAIAENIKLKEGVTLNLCRNGIGDAGAGAISKMELKEGVELALQLNRIRAEGAKAISKMKLKEGIYLDLGDNQIGDAGAEAISKMELKEGVTLVLESNEIGEKMKKKLKEREKSYHDRGINCEVEV